MKAKTLIAIPVYNSVDFIEKTIESAFNQSVPVNVLVCDNCSTDGTLELLNELKTNKYKDLIIIKYPLNYGRKQNWKICLEFFAKSNYELIKFLFAGDIIYTNCIETVEHYYDLHPDLGALAFPYFFVDNNNRYLSAHKKYYNCILTPREITKINLTKGGILGAIISNVYTKYGVKDFKFDTAFISKLTFDIRVLETTSLFYINKPLADFNLSNRGTFDKANSAKYFLDFSAIEFNELERIKAKDYSLEFNYEQIEQKIIINTLARMLQFIKIESLLHLILISFKTLIIASLKSIKNTPLGVFLKKIKYASR